MNYYRKEIFSTSIYHGTVPDNNKIKKLIIPYIEKMKKDEDNNKPPEGWLTDKLVTSFDNEDVTNTLWNPDNDIGTELRNQYLKLIDGFFAETKWTIDIKHIWYNYYTNGEWQEGHKHLGSWKEDVHFAFVHFISYDKDLHSPLFFNDPLEDQRALSLELDPDQDVGKYSPSIREGDAVMFPCYLEHEVRPGKPTPNYPRVTVAMNISVLNYGDGEDDDD